MPAASASRTVAVLPGLPSRMKATHSVRTERDHLGVAAVTGGPAVAVPVCRVRLDLVAGRPDGAGGGDRVGSSRAGAMDQDDAAGMAGQDDREGLADRGGVVPGPAAGDQETERRAHLGARIGRRQALPQRCCAAWRVTPRRAAMSAQE